jgi:phosphoribosylformylglycinamidine (FGAM) synthase-like enzyme
MCDTAQFPGGDAAVIRVHGNSKKAIAASVDCTPRYCNSHPFTGGMQAVCETYRNLCAVGAEPIAITNCLNFGNPEKPEIMGQFVGVIKGMTEACKKLNYPVISGNVSLYNETNGIGINPTPTIGGVGLIKDVSKVKNYNFKNKNNTIYVIGKTEGHLEQSILCYDLLHLKKGPPPSINLDDELNNGKAVRSLIENNLIDSCHDISSGGLILCLLEMSIGSDIGFEIETNKKGFDRIKFLFGEDQSRYMVEVNNQNKDSFENYLKKSNIIYTKIGKTSEKVCIDNDLKFDLEELSKLNKSWFYEYNN